MPYTTQKEFDRIVTTSSNLMKYFDGIEEPIKAQYPKDMDLDEIEGRKIKNNTDTINKKTEDLYRFIKEEGEGCKKNLDDLIKSKKKSLFGLVRYEKIKTNDWGKICIEEFTRYIQTGIDAHHRGMLEIALGDEVGRRAYFK